MCLLEECVKFVVFAFNLVFVIVGTALIIYQVNFTEITKASPDSYRNVELIPILPIVVGSVIFVISFFGCCGVIRSSPCLLTSYAVILLIIVILQIALGVFAFLEIKNEDDLEINVYKTMNDIFHKADNASVELIDFIQDKLHCCGTDGPKYWDERGKNPPKSCYSDDIQTKVYKEGCQGNFFHFLKDLVQIIGIVMFTLAPAEVIGATFAFCLANYIRNSQSFAKMQPEETLEMMK